MAINAPIDDRLSSPRHPMRTVSIATAFYALWLTLLSAPAPASADNGDGQLVNLINAYRQSAQVCDGKTVGPVGPLTPDEALARTQTDSGTQLQAVLQKGNFRAAKAIGVTGAADPSAAMAAIKDRYCTVLLAPEYAAIGVSRRADAWRIVLAQPLLDENLGPWRDAGRTVLELVNEARKEARQCGQRGFEPAPAVSWDSDLADAALMHSEDMAQRNQLSHRGVDGGLAGERASTQGYRWRQIGENVARGQGSASQVVAGWLASPEHCANIMNAEFTEMGAAYALGAGSGSSIYWTQVFAMPR